MTLALVFAGLLAARAPEPMPSVRPIGPSEEELVEGLRARDPLISDRVYRLYAPEVTRMLRRMLGDDPEIADLRHEAFIQALQSIHRFRGDSTLKTWLIGIAVRCALNRLRYRKRRRWLSFSSPEALPERVDPSPLASTTVAVYRIFAQLEAEEQVVFSLHYIEGMTLEETASAMSTSVGTVKRRLRSAKDSFKKLALGDPTLRQYAAEVAP